MFDVEALRSAANCRDVAEFIGMRVSGRYCECVSGLHSESQLNHCAIYSDHIYCFSCGVNLDVIRMVLEYYKNVLGTPITYNEACRIVGDACGGSDLYETTEATRDEIARPPFDKEAMRMLLMDAAPHGDHPMTPALLYRADPEAYMHIIAARAKEIKQRCEDLQKALGKTPTAMALKLEAQQRIEKLNSIIEKTGQKPRLPKFFTID